MTAAPAERILVQLHIAEHKDGIEVTVRRGPAFRRSKFKTWRQVIAAISAAVEGIGE